MANITVKDLEMDKNLDSVSMLQIIGGHGCHPPPQSLLSPPHQIPEESRLLRKKGHLCEKIQSRSRIQDHYRMLLALKPNNDSIELKKEPRE